MSHCLLIMLVPEMFSSYKLFSSNFNIAEYAQLGGCPTDIINYLEDLKVIINGYESFSCYKIVKNHLTVTN